VPHREESRAFLSFMAIGLGHPAGGPGERMTDDQRRRFDQVYAVHHAAILGYALRRTSNADDAADVIAETFLIAWRRIDDIPAGESARPWLYGVARRVLANQRRGEQRRSALGDRLRSELAAERFRREPPPGLDEVAAAHRSLGDTDREILTLAAWEGLDARQIAVVLGCSSNAARIRLHRARRRLAAALDDTRTTFAPELIRGNS
jgi:RNA polymerase sigma factor (sigma-70 family)